MHSQALNTKYAGIDCLEHLGPTTAEYNVILLHGYGANSSDLFPLAQHMQTPSIKRWVFPNGIQGLPGFAGGRAWFDIDVAALEQAMMTGQPRDFSSYLARVRPVAERVQKLIKEADLDEKKTLIGGFSQGAMLATHIALSHPIDFAGLVILSGAFLGTDEWVEMAQKRKLPFFQSHGEQDPVLPYDSAETLFHKLNDANWDGHLHAFRGQHEIPAMVLKRLNEFFLKYTR